MWLSHASFPAVVEASWATPCFGKHPPQFILAYKLKTLKNNLKVWNFEVFGQLKKQIARVENSVLEVQMAFDANPTNPLLHALNPEKSLFHNRLNVEAINWKQKSRIR